MTVRTRIFFDQERRPRDRVSYFLARDDETESVFVRYAWNTDGETGATDIPLDVFLRPETEARKKLLGLIGALVEDESNA